MQEDRAKRENILFWARIVGTRKSRSDVDRLIVETTGAPSTVVVRDESASNWLRKLPLNFGLVVSRAFSGVERRMTRIPGTGRVFPRVGTHTCYSRNNGIRPAVEIYSRNVSQERYPRLARARARN